MSAIEGSSTMTKRGIAKWFEGIGSRVEKTIKYPSSIRRTKSLDIKLNTSPKEPLDLNDNDLNTDRSVKFALETAPAASYWDAPRWVSNSKKRRNSTSSSSYGDVASTFSRSSAGSWGARSTGSNRSTSIPFPYPVDLPPLENDVGSNFEQDVGAEAKVQTDEVHQKKKVEKIQKKLLVRARKRTSHRGPTFNTNKQRMQRSNPPPISEGTNDKWEGLPSPGGYASDIEKIDKLSAHIKALEDRQRLQEQEALRLKDELQHARSALRELQFSSSHTRKSSDTNVMVNFPLEDGQKLEPISLMAAPSESTHLFDNSRPRVRPRTSQERLFASNLDDRYMSWL